MAFLSRVKISYSESEALNGLGTKDPGLRRRFVRAFARFG